MLYPYYLGLDVPTQRAETIAILELEVVVSRAEAVDVASTQVANGLTVAMRNRAARGPFAIAPNSNVHLIDEKLMHNCDDERKECMIAIGRRLHADHLLFGHLAKSRGGGYQVTLKMLDTRNGQLTQSSALVPASDLSGSALVNQGVRIYDQMIARDRAADAQRAVDGVLVRATNEAFWQKTDYKRGQPLDMSIKRDRELSKTWLDLYQQNKARRDRATSVAQRMLNETVNPYVLVIEARDGTLQPQTFPQRTNLDVQYTWLVDQPEFYAYVAMFDFTQRKDRPLFEQFALTKREQTPVSGWYSYAPW